MYVFGKLSTKAFQNHMIHPPFLGNKKNLVAIKQWGYVEWQSKKNLITIQHTPTIEW
jgi:hypothetical protein